MLQGLAAAVPLAHPRLHLPPATLAKLGELLRQHDPPALGPDALRLRAIVDSVRTACIALLDGPLPPPIDIGVDLYIPGGEAWEVRYLADGEAGFVAAREGGTAAAVGATTQQLSIAALGHALLGAGAPDVMAGVSRAALLERARQCLAALAAMPLPATGYANSHGFRVEAQMAVGLDLLWNALPADEREALMDALVVRAQEFHQLSVKVALVDPRDSHAVTYGKPSAQNPHHVVSLVHQPTSTQATSHDILSTGDPTHHHMSCSHVLRHACCCRHR